MNHIALGLKVVILVVTVALIWIELKFPGA